MRAAGDSATAVSKVFCFFFSKKKAFLPSVRIHDAVPPNRHPAPRLHPPADRPRHHRHHAVRAAGRARPDGRRPRGPRHRRPARRLPPPLLDRHRLPAHLHLGHAHLRQAVRHVRPAQAAADRARGVHRRLRAVCAGAILSAAHRRARGAGHRRRRADGDGAGGDRRRRGPCRAWPLPGLPRGDVGCRLRGRPGAGRLGHRPPVLDLRLLGEPAARLGRHLAVRPRAARAAGAPRRRPHRLSGCRPADLRGDGPADGAELGRRAAGLVFGSGAGPDRRRRCC